MEAFKAAQGSVALAQADGRPDAVDAAVRAVEAAGMAVVDTHSGSAGAAACDRRHVLMGCSGISGPDAVNCFTSLAQAIKQRVKQAI